ncbi:hypothetical protein B0H19DRAFT_1118274 [Mycena capillaripes]|nr:hypothetical protein B0H19DRAFT_1118274 [Mycena capillaripes]
MLKLKLLKSFTTFSWSSSTSDILLGNGRWIENLAQLNSGRLIRLSPDTEDTFYVKILVTSREDPMYDKTRLQFMKHFATEELSISFMGLYGGNSSQMNAVPVDAPAYAHPDSMFTMVSSTPSRTVCRPTGLQGILELYR